jgi:dUTPase
MPTVAFATTAPEGSVTCPRKLPADADEEAAAVDVWACECAKVDAMETDRLKIRIEVVIELVIELAKADRCCKLYLLLSRQFKL